jgi:ketosteroid isomerase-like protein
MTTNKTDIKSQILKNENELLNAFRKCDLNVLDELICEDALFILPNGSTVTKSIVLDNYRSGNTAMTSINSSDQKINLIDDTAVVSVNLEMTGKYNDQVISQQFRYLRVWKLFTNSWKVIAVSGIPLSKN